MGALAVLLAFGLAHLVGSGRLIGRCGPVRARTRRRERRLFQGGVLVVLLCVVSPIDYWARVYFTVHMFQHLLLMFAAPVLLVLGAPWLAYRSLVDPPRRHRLRGRLRTARSHGAGEPKPRPWLAVVFLNVVMIAWHLPALLDLANRNQLVHVWLMETSFVLAGILFWRELVGSFPLSPRLGYLQRLGAVVVTNLDMWLIAMSLSLFTTSASYAAYIESAAAHGFSAFSDQQLGAGVLWICGEFWATPALYVIVRDWLTDPTQQLSLGLHR